MSYISDIPGHGAHTLFVGKTGVGKSTLLRDQVSTAAARGHGVVLLDPHGDLADDARRDLPRRRRNDLALLDPTCPQPRSMNPLRGLLPADRALGVANIVAAIRKLFPEHAWGHRTESLLRHAALAAAEVRGGSLRTAHRILVDERYRVWALARGTDEAVRAFFLEELASWSKHFAAEAVAAPSNKLSALLAVPAVARVLIGARPRLDVARVLERNGILIAKLSKGAIGEDGSRLLGGILLGLVKSALLARERLPREERRPVVLAIDELASFPESIVLELLAEGRKYGVSVLAATQSLAVLPRESRAAILGNTETLVVFRVGGEDAELLAKELGDVFGPHALTGLDVGQAVVREGHRRPELRTFRENTS